jgi:hypothetical protein
VVRWLGGYYAGAFAIRGEERYPGSRRCRPIGFAYQRTPRQIEAERFRERTEADRYAFLLGYQETSRHCEATGEWVSPRRFARVVRLRSRRGCDCMDCRVERATGRKE